jgi:hypothetical protein
MNGFEFLDEARGTVAARAKSLSHKIQASVWYAAREKIRHAPRKIPGLVASFIPFVGGAVSTTADAIVNAVVKARQDKKAQALRGAAGSHGENTRLEDLRKLAKHEAKDLKSLSEKVDENLPKLKDAVLAFNTVNEAFALSTSQGVSPSIETAWNLALAFCEMERYQDKLLILTGTMRARLDEVEKYLDECRNKTIATEVDLVAELDSIYSALELLRQLAVPEDERNLMNHGARLSTATHQYV